MVDTKISDLTEATSVDGTELLLLSVSATDKHCTLATLRDYAAGWVRPTDWPTLPSDTADTIVITAGVWDHSSNFAALSVTVSSGTYSVDWGDGTSDTGVASATQVDHQYTYADGDLGSVTSAGYKCALITITTSGGNITAFNLGKKHTQSGLGTYSNPWLDIRVNAPSATSMTYRGGVEARLVQNIGIVAIGAITTLANTFQNCFSLQSVSFPSGSLSGVTTLSTAFYYCSSLQSVTFPSGSLSGVTTLANAFQNCSSLQSVSFPSGSLSGVTTLANAFSSCYSLQSLSFPSGSLSGVTTLANAFSSCYSLQSLSFPSGSLSGVTTLANAFQNCSSLQSVSFPSGWAPSSLTTTTAAFGSCPALARIQNCAIPVSFSVASCALSASELDEIYTALPSASATITVTSNWGTAADTPTIATGKGWTVTS